MGNKVRKLLGSSTAKLGENTDINLGLEFTANRKSLVDSTNSSQIVNQGEVYDLERQSNGVYRIYGNIRVITTNELNVDDWDIFPQVENETNKWDFKFNNWAITLLYPSEKDEQFTINSKGVTTKAFKGVPIDKQFVKKAGEKGKLGVTTKMKHGLKVGDYAYIYNNSITYKNRGYYYVESLGDENGDNPLYSFVTSFIVENNTPLSNQGNMIKVLDASQNDITSNDLLNGGDYQQTSNLSTYTLNGENYVKIDKTNHGLTKNQFIEIKSVVNNMNGIFKVFEVLDGDNFLIKENFVTSNTINFRLVDGVPSEYYVRKYKIINVGTETYNTAFSRSIYPKTLQNNLGISNLTYSYEFINDVNVNQYKSHIGGKLTEVYVGFIKRANGQWGTVISDWEDNWETTDTRTSVGFSKIETITENDGTIGIDQEFIGDFVEFNRTTLDENVISETIHWFGVDGETNTYGGYYLKPYRKLKIREYSSIIEKAGPEENISNIPPETITLPNGDRAWRDMLKIGVFEDNRGVDYPYKNNCNYFYNNNILYIKVQKPDRDVNIVEEDNFKIGNVEC